MNYLYYEIGSKIVLWFHKSNKYLFFDSLFYKIFKLFNEYSKEEAEVYLANKLFFSEELIKESYQSYKTITDQLSVQNSCPSVNSVLDPVKKWDYSCTYLVYGIHLKLRFSSKFAKELIHPKYTHLQTESQFSPTHTIDVVHQSNNLSLLLNNSSLGEWALDEAHFLQGKFALLLINLCNDKIESNWMATLHASAVYKNNNNAFVFLGESGSGKSTAITLLTLTGYKLLADDFVAIEAMNKRVYSFPAAISLKENVLDQMEFFFPQLKITRLRYKDEKTNYKYLYPQKQRDSAFSKPVKALILIKYCKGASTSLKPIATCKALELIIPDSWISPLSQNVSSFLNWIQEVPTYRLEYSDNEDFINTIDRL